MTTVYVSVASFVAVFWPTCNSRSATRRWPVDEIGKNSVIPSTAPRTTAFTAVSSFDATVAALWMAALWMAAFVAVSPITTVSSTNAPRPASRPTLR